VDTASSKPADLVLPSPSEQHSIPIADAADLNPAVGPVLPPSLLHELWGAAEAENCGLTRDEFDAVLRGVGAKLNHGQPPGVESGVAQKAAFFRALHLSELALASACALGRDAAWGIFLGRYRGLLVQAGVSITGSASLGEELADSLYAELYGLRETGGERRSPLASYSGRGSLAGWLRTTLVQRYRDYHRRTHRDAPLDGVDSPAPTPSAFVGHQVQLTTAIVRVLKSLAAEDRFLLNAYFLDRQTLLQLAQTFHVHEATMSRRVKRLTDGLRRRLVDELVAGGLAKAAATEALAADPRDIEINLRVLLQSSQTSTFSSKEAWAASTATDPL
jgi:RNA polymerase sigma-70 factor (ECF subfamily)